MSIKIAFITDGQESIPPSKIGGIEWMVHYIATHLGKKGYEVDVYGTVNTEYKYQDYQVIPIHNIPLRNDPSCINDDRLKQIKILSGLSKAVKIMSNTKYDIIHNHAGRLFLLFAPYIKGILLTTIHGDLHNEYQQYLFNEYKDLPYISISHMQRNPVEGKIHFLANIYNGINLAQFPFRETIGSPNIVFFGRLGQRKGVLEAVQIAQLLNKHIKVAGFTDIEEDKKYFDAIVKKYNQSLISSVGPLYQEEKVDFIANSKLFLFPLQWEEPFGLVMVESMSTGTPVVAFARGSIPEVIKDGKTGFIVNPSQDDIRGNWIIKKTGNEGLLEAVERIYSMSIEQYTQMRKQCRNHVENNFTIEKMVQSYEKVYSQLSQ